MWDEYYVAVIKKGKNNLGDLIIKCIDKSTMEDQIHVFMDSFSHNTDEYKTISIKWEKKHFQNPVGDSFIFGAFDAGMLVGINCFLQMRYDYNGEKIKVLQSCESGVKKSYQRQGIWGKIMAFAREYLLENTDTDIIIGFPNFQNSYPGFVKLGWKTLLFEKNMVLINSGSKILEMYFGKRWWNVIGHLLEIQRIIIELKASPRYSVIKSQNCMHKKNSDRMVTLKCNSEWLEWKQCYAGIETYEIRKKEKKIAYVITQEEFMHGLKYLKILDYFAVDDKKEKDAALASFLKFVKKKDYSLIRVWNKDEMIYKKLGFIELKRHVNPFIINLLNEKKKFLENKNLWNPSFLDLD